MKIGQSASSSSSSSSSSTSISQYPVALGLACFSHVTSSPSPNPLHVPGTTLRTLRTPAAGGSGGGRLARTLFSVRARCLFSENLTQADEMDENEAFHGEGGEGGGCSSGRYSTMKEFMSDLMGVFVDVLCTTDESLVAMSSLWMLSQQQRLYEQQQQQAQARGDQEASNDGEDGGMMDVDGNHLDDRDRDGDLPSSSSSSSSSAEASGSATSNNSSPPVHIPDLLTHIRQVAHHTTPTNHTHFTSYLSPFTPLFDGLPALI